MPNFTIDYIILILLCALILIWIVYKVSLYQSGNNLDNQDDSDNDGGTPFDLPPPVLDLPPGIILPLDDPQSVWEQEEQLI